MSIEDNPFLKMQKACQGSCQYPSYPVGEERCYTKAEMNPGIPPNHSFKDRRRNVRIDSIEAIAALRRDTKHMIILGLSMLFLIVAPTFAAYVLREKINFFFQQHGIKVRVFVPHDSRAMQR